ncbi:selenocysteine lyase/cysteine desulfurase [Tenacibaculum skagerrakense]|uniref:Selenocysteine lyase/cysteine desulfurase n=1 Tax=Tenacibaculum skagerrakense TaxID=186571 RepID=A0A4R2NSK2_9FLAO|nr:aminotransferase class V-fold PLP-dependent enzyme [Tenacibaculum skagerrakense]TCP24365.1 selenocysteine lyase/cysteine desulfurase [Tenacibaculum skagerrakense]
MSLTNQKHLFDLPEGITYLNIASQSPSFKSVEEAGIKTVKEKSKPYIITASRYFDPIVKLKKLFAQLVKADDYNRIACIPSVSYGLSTVANNIKLNEGDEILLIEEQFPSNYYVWERLANKYKATIKIAKQPNTTENKGKLWNENILNAISNKTAVIAMGNIHWANGTLFNLKAIREKATVHNSLFIIDGSQSVGALPFSVEELQPDALICAGYKWLFGPYGCAYGYFGSYFDNGIPLEENWSNRLNSENLSGLTNYQTEYKPLANRYCVGEHGSFIYTEMQIAALTQLLKWNPVEIQEYCLSITSDFIKKLREVGCIIEEDEFRAKHLFGIQLPNHVNIESIKNRLQQEQIFVSYRGNYVRISCHLFNTKEDFDKLTKCFLSEIQ